MTESRSKSFDYTGPTSTPMESPYESRNATMTDLPSVLSEFERRGSEATLFDSSSPTTKMKDQEIFDQIEEEITAHENLVKNKSTDEKSKMNDTEKNQNEEPSHGRLLPLPRFILVYGCLGLSMFLTSLDQTIVACILPNISSEFGAKNAPWVGISFLLLQTTFSPCYGRMSDVFGRKPLLIAALVIFLLGTGICGGAPNIETLIVARSIAGIGGAGLLSMVHICISDIVTLRKRGIYHGMISAVNGTGSVLGPLVGGIFASTPSLGWRWAFYFQLPIIAFAAVATLLALPKLGNSDKRLLRQKLRTIDYMGSLLFVGGTTLTLLGLLFLSPPEVQFGSALVAAPFFIGLAMLGFFAVWEIKFAFQPIVPFHIFRILAIDQIYILNFVFGYVFYAVLYYLPEFYQVVAGQDAVQASLSLMPVVVTSIAFSWLTGLMTTFIGRYKWSIVLGIILQLVASICLYLLFVPGIQDGIAIAIMILMGFGFGCQMQTNLVGAQSATHQKMVAVATSVRNFSRNIGGVLGIAFSGIIIHVRFPTTLNEELPVQFTGQIQGVVDDPLSIRHLGNNLGEHANKIVELYARVLRKTFLVYIVLGAFALVVAILLHEYSLTRGKDGEPVRMVGMQTVAYRRIKAFVHKKKHQQQQQQPRRKREDSQATEVA